METEYDSSDNQELQQENEDQITDTEGTNWKFWCRLCAKDRLDNICIYDAKSFASNVDIVIAIDKYFSSKIRIKEQQLPENLCRECYNFLKKLLDFEKRIEEVQELFAELISCNSSITETLLTEDDENQELDCTDENDFLTNDIEQNPLEIIDESIEEACEEILEIEKITNDNVSSSKKFITILKCDSKDDYKCMHCPKVFKRRAFFESHLKAHENYEDTHKVVQCPQCDLKLLSTSLTAHIRKIHIDGHKYLCDECGKSCRTIHSLEEHKLIHSNYSPHVCSYCDSAFKKLSALNRHIQYVHDPNKYFCNVCNAEFKSNLTLKNHMITHSKTRPFKCDFCGYSFRHARNLKVHLIAHTGLKLYHCDICDRSYGSATTLRSHKKKLHPDELAAQEALGAKRFGHSVPNIAYLKALTKNPNSLKPIVRRGVQNKMDNRS